MNRTIFLLILLVFSVFHPAYSHTFKAIVGKESAEEVVLRDTATGDEWVAAEGKVGDVVYKLYKP